MKPTNGVVGRWPIPEWIDLSTFGPLGHTVADVRLLLEIEAGPVPRRPERTADARWRWASAMPSRAFASPRLVDYGPLPGPVQALFDAAVDAFERDVGLPVERIDAEEIFRAGHVSEDWVLICAMEHVHHFGGSSARRTWTGSPRCSVASWSSRGRTPFEEYMAARRRRFDYVRELDLLLGDDAVLLTPTNCFAWIRADGTHPATGKVGDSARMRSTPIRRT